MKNISIAASVIFVLSLLHGGSYAQVGTYKLEKLVEKDSFIYCAWLKDAKILSNELSNLTSGQLNDFYYATTCYDGFEVSHIPQKMIMRGKTYNIIETNIAETGVPVFLVSKKAVEQ